MVFMGIGKSIKNFYFALEDKYYAFVDFLDKHGIPMYKFVDFFENRNIPSFPVFILLILFVVLLVWFIFFSGFLANTTQLTVIVTDKNEIAIEGAKIKIYVANEIFSEAVTNAEGKAFLQVPLNKEFELKVEQIDFKPYSTQLTLTQEETKIIKLEKEIKLITKNISFIAAGTQNLIQDVFTVTVSCSEAEFTETKTVYNGRLTLENIPENCGTLTFSSEDFTIKNNEISLEEEEPIIYLEKLELRTGTIEVRVEDNKGNPVSNAEVKLMNTNKTSSETDDLLVEHDVTDDTGITLFSEVPIGEYYAFIYTNGQYADTTTETKELLENGKIILSAKLIPTEESSINVLVLDEENKPVENTKIQLYRENILVASNYTNSEGKLTLNVSVNTTYSLIADKPGYFIERINVSPQSEYYEIHLKKQTKENAQTIIVKVLDLKGRPIENARVMLKVNDEVLAAPIQVTGIDGKTEFTNVKAGQYFVLAVKDGFASNVSEPFNLRERETKEIEVELDIADALIEFYVLNEDSEEITTATIKLIDSEFLQQIDSSNTSVSPTTFTVRADKKVFAVIEAADYLTYVTSLIKLSGNATTKKEIILRKNVLKPTIEFNGLTLNEEKVSNTLSEGQIYDATFIFNIPKEIAFDSAGIHIRTGLSYENKTNLMEEDTAFIKEVSTAKSLIKGSTSYTPFTGTAIDKPSNLNANIKWAEIEWLLDDKILPKQGITLEANAKIQVSASALPGEQVLINYRGFAISGSVKRDPEDAVLGSNLENAARQRYYANAYTKIYTIGPNNLCVKGFCRSYAIEDLSNKTKQNILDSFVAKEKQLYALYFSLNKESKGSIGNAELVLNNESGSLTFKKIELIDATGTQVKEQLNGFTFNKIIGTLNEGSTISGILFFETSKSGLSPIKLSIKALNEEKFSEEILIDVTPAKEMKIELLPLEIVPLIDNELIIKVTDSENKAVSNAIVNIYLDNVLLNTDNTNAEGITIYRLEKPNAGSLLKIKASKVGFKDKEIEKTIDASILTVIPATIDFDLEAGTKLALEKGLILLNNTPINLKIKKIILSNEFSDLIKMEVTESPEKIESGKDANLFLAFSLTDKGILIEQTTSLEGSISLIVSNDELNQSWLTVIPVKARILLGGEVNQKECLKILPQEWQIITEREQKTIKAKLSNECAVESNPIPLKNVSARITQTGNSIGLLSVKIGTKTFDLKEEFTKIADLINENSEIEMQLIFSPNTNIKTAKQSLALELKAEHSTFRGKEELKTQMNIEAIINILDKCIEVSYEEPLKLSACGYNLGYDYYSSYWNRMPSYSAYPSMFAGTSFYGSAYGPAIGNYYGFEGAYPFAPSYTLYRRPWETSYGYSEGSPYTSSFSCGEPKTITIKNNCDIPIEAKIEASEALSIEKKTITIGKKSEAKTSIKPTDKIGRYDLSISARKSQTEDEFSLIKELIVEVYRADEIPLECRLTLTPKRFTVPFLGWHGSEGKIVNRCYDLGYRIIADPQIICYTVESAGLSWSTSMLPTSYGSFIPNLGACPLVNWIDTGTPKVIRISEKESQEILDFLVRFKLPILDQWPGFIAGNPSKELGNLRLEMGRLYHSIVSPGKFIAPLILPNGTKTQEVFDITIVDPYQSSGAIEGFNCPGSPIIKGNECLRQGALDFLQQYGYQGPLFVGDIWTIDNSSADKVLLVTALTRGQHYTNEGCSCNDYLTIIGPKEFETESGLIIKLEESQQGKNIKVEFDRHNLKENCVIVTMRIPVRVTRTLYPHLSSETMVNLRAGILKKGVSKAIDCIEEIPEAREGGKPPTTPEIPQPPEEIPAFGEKCSGDTGTEAYKNYGFNRLLFKWNDLKGNECDFDLLQEPTEKGFFCDGEQFIKTMKEKINKIGNQETIAKLKGIQIDDDSSNTKENTNATEDTLPTENESAKHGYDFSVISTAEGKIKAVNTEETKNKQECNADNIMKYILSGIENTTTQIPNIKKFGEDAKKKLKECYGENAVILGLIEGIEQEDNTIFKELQSKGLFELIPAENKYVITFDEYIDLHNSLLTNCYTKNDDGTYSSKDECIGGIGPITDNKNKITVNFKYQDWINFINLLRNKTTFIVALKDKPVIPVIAQQSNDYKTGNVYLIKDNFEKISEIKVKYCGKTEWNKQQECKENTNEIESGVYNYYVTINENNEIEVQLWLIWSLEELDNLKFKDSEAIIESTERKYNENNLLRIAFDPNLNPKTTKELPLIGSGMNIIYSKAKKDGIISTEISNKFSDTRTSKILQIEPEKIIYSPSVPVILNASSKGKTAYYGFTNTNTPLRESAIEKANQGNYEGINAEIFNWNNAESNLNLWQDSICKTWQTKIFVEKMSGNLNSKAITFVPEKNNLMLALVCSDETFNLNATIKSLKASETRKAYIEGKKLFTGNVVLNLKTQQNAAIKDFIDAIKDSKVCVSNENNTTILSWNPEKFTN